MPLVIVVQGSGGYIEPAPGVIVKTGLGGGEQPVPKLFCMERELSQESTQVLCGFLPNSFDH